MYKFNEGEILKEIKEYIDGTYGQHYSSGKIQSTEFIIDVGHGEGFALGNIIKYASVMVRRMDLIRMICSRSFIMVSSH